MADRKKLVGQIQEPGQTPRNVTIIGRFTENVWATRMKSLIETRQSTTTLTDDSELIVRVEANSVYILRGEIFFDTGATPDFKFAVQGPTSPDEVLVHGRTTAVGAATESVIVDTAFGTSHSVTGTSGTTGGYVALSIAVNTGSNAGVVKIQWAQNTSDATDTSVLAGSYLEWMRVGQNQDDA